MPNPDSQYVDLTWPPDQIRDFCQRNDNWILEIPSEWTADDVKDLYQRQLTITMPYIGVISEIAGDARVSARTLEDIWSRFGSAIEVSAALATNPAAPISLLKELALHENEDVREHARSSLARARGGA